MASLTEPLNRTEVDGVRCLWAEGKGDDLLAALLFRVGVADESMRINGVSHLVEHLALPSSPVSRVPFNGTVDLLTTLFWAQGPPQPALDLIAQVAATLSDPPLARLPLERSILRAEAAQRPSSNWHNALALRYGPVAHGLGIYEEYAVRAATDEQVAEWAATRFTKANAILYLTGPPPDDLVLPLPAGENRPPPLPKPIPYIDYPSAYPVGPEGCVVVSLVAARSAASATAIDVGVRRLRHRLRVESGTTYHVSWATEALDRDRMHVLITADCLPTEIDSTRGLMIATLDDLAFDGPTTEELAEVVDDVARFMRDPDWLGHNLHYAALEELLERPFVTLDESIAARERLTADEVATALKQAFTSMLLMLPREATLPAGRFTEYPLSAPNRPAPRRVFYRRKRRPWHRRSGELFFVGHEGVMSTQRGQWWAVRYDECVAGLRWKDGSRELWSADGFLVSIRPEEWKHGAAAVRAIDDHAPPEIWITMDAGESSEVAAPDDVVETGAEARIQLLRDELERQPEEGSLWDQLAAALIDMEEWSSAVDAADRAAALDSSDAWARRMKARALVEAGRDTEAIEAIADALRIDAAGLRTLSDAAYVLCEAGAAERAVRYADRAVELYPGDGDAWFARGRVFESLGPLEQAAAAYRRAAELEPDDVWWHSNLGGILVKQGLYEEAVVSLRTALDLDPWHSAARFSLARAYGLSGDLQRARKLRAASNEKVIEDARAWIERHPTDAAARCRLAEALGELGRPAEALREAQAALEFAPDDPDTVEQAAWSALDAGEDDEAAVHLATLTSIEVRTCASYVEEACLAALLGDAEIAAHAVRGLQEGSPSDVQSRLVAGYAAAAGAEWEAAGTSFLEALECAPRNCCAQTWHGLAEVEAGAIASAIAAYERAEALNTCECAARQRLRLRGLRA